MAGPRPAALARHLEVLFQLGATAQLSDGDLLARFLNRDASGGELAFAALVDRHGPMVRATCRRLLRDPGDADDAFQAAFLLLARRARSIRSLDSLGPWLHRVARHAALRARARSARRSAVERHASPRRPDDEAPTLVGDDLRAVLDEELDRLPGAFRAPLVLCYLEGLTHDEAAARLGCPVGTLRSRLARGRDRLRARLVRRGLAPTAAVLGARPGPTTTAVPAALVDPTARAAAFVAAGDLAAARPIAGAACRLLQGVTRAMFLRNLGLVAFAALNVACLTGLVVALAGRPDEPPESPTAAPPRPAPVESEGTWADLAGRYDVASFVLDGRRQAPDQWNFDECWIIGPQPGFTKGTNSVGWLIWMKDGRLFEEWPVERLDPSADPKALLAQSQAVDLGVRPPRNDLYYHRGIYRLRDDELTFAFSPGGFPPDRIAAPLGFAAAGKGQSRVVLKRWPADDLREVRRRSVLGEWRVERVEGDDGPLPEPALGSRWRLGPRWVEWIEDDQVVRTFTYDPKTRTGVCDFRSETTDPLKLSWWHEDRGRTLRLTYGVSPPKRPGPFEPGPGRVVVVLRRLTDPPSVEPGPGERP